MDNLPVPDNTTTCGIPHAEEVEDVEIKESSYEFQYSKIVEEVKKIGKATPTVCLIFKALPLQSLVEELEKQGYRVKFDSYYDSTKETKYNTKLRITNPKFATGGQDFVDRLEDQLKGCAYTKANFQVSEEAKNLFDSFMGSFNLKN